MFSRGVPASAVAVAAFFTAAVLPRATWPLNDGDVWWHIRAGQEVLSSGAVPQLDSWSIAGAGRPWTSQDWGANVLLAAGDALGPWGETALSFLFGALVVLAFWVIWRAIALRVSNIGWMSRTVWLSIGLALAGPVMGVRVQVLDLVMAALVLWICWRYVSDPRRRWLAGLPLVAVVWANLHAGWLLIFLIAGAVLVGETVDRLLRRDLIGAPPLSWRQLRDLGLAMVAAAVVLVLNPNGLALLTYPLYTVGISSLHRYVMEWFPATLETLFGQLLAGFVVVGVVPTLVLGRRRLRTADALILVGLTVMAYQAIRFLLILGPIGAAITAVVLSPIVAQSTIGRRSAAILARLSAPAIGNRGRTNAVLMLLLIVLGIGVALIRVSPPAQASEISRVLPVRAVTWLDEHPQGTRIFNRYEWGGYIGEHRPDQLVFMDGRADVYGDQLLRMYVSIIGLEADPQILFDRYGIDYAVFPPDTPLAGWFDASSAWERVYLDDTAAVWTRR
ncbi:MAG: hypothetical protein ABI864_01860 [Chloroflexota bacterium]